MAGTLLAFTLLMLAGLEDIQANLNPHGGTMKAKPYLDPKRRSEIVDETFLEQKDILLELLETKLKEVRDKRKKRNNTINDLDKTNGKHLENVDVKLTVNGISAVGDTNLELKYGTGKGLVNLDAHGISNIGNAHVELGVGETGLFIPGLTSLFVDGGHVNASNNVHVNVHPSKNVDVNVTSTEATTTEKADISRRSHNKANLNETTVTVAATLTTATITPKHHTKIIDRASPVNNSTVQVWNTPDLKPLVTANSTASVASNTTVS